MRDSSKTVAIYGDSFAMASEVDNEDAWPALITKSKGWNVENYGIRGYGPGQALLRFERHLEAGRIPDIAVFSIFENDISRAVLRYWSFYKSYQPFYAGFKPRFTLEDGEVVVVRSPLQEPVRDKAHLRQTISTAIEQDDWYPRRTDIRFPFTLAAMGHAVRVIYPPKPDWQRPDSVELLHAISARFVEQSLDRGITPVILFIPTVANWKNGDKSVPYGALIERMRADLGVTVIDIAGVDFDAERFSILRYKGHASPYGNQVIADAVASTIAHVQSQQGLRPPSSLDVRS